tara:strand:+ start:172 stop:372 length:201 start_codon:yes stop_codon:yes gene_type:complete
VEKSKYYYEYKRNIASCKGPEECCNCCKASCCNCEIKCIEQKQKQKLKPLVAQLKKCVVAIKEWLG